VKIYVEAVEALVKNEAGVKLSSSPKLVEKLIWIPVILFCKISFPVTHFDTLIMPKRALLAP
jgi:hypothetical protein